MNLKLNRVEDWPELERPATRSVAATRDLPLVLCRALG